MEETAQDSPTEMNLHILLIWLNALNLQAYLFRCFRHASHITIKSLSQKRKGYN